MSLIPLKTKGILRKYSHEKSTQLSSLAECMPAIPPNVACYAQISATLRAEIVE